ncbi:hypothetical protein [Herbiconiux ginsengi]|uniref:Uncharacterized protein n=1 Tax=Herbiconiux ginsengi TaxID=381665 RepID=A0A1H3QQM3_9MICO|nr:hypothetical protein [Herbiconiux ginsengi]SDZ15824.1 hypothetical protein SAMN05216554_2691 [Herbiconiux ginsengi]
MDAPSVIIGIIVYVVGFAVAILVLSAVIRNAVRRGVEDVLYTKGKDGLWSANPWVISIAKEVAAETRKTDA